MFLGIDDNQYRATREFVKNSKKKAGNSEELRTFALGHSLANNNQVLAQLIDGEFDEVYGVNGAQISIDQLLLADRNLVDFLLNKYDLSRQELKELPREQLKKQSPNTTMTKASQQTSPSVFLKMTRFMASAERPILLHLAM